VISLGSRFLEGLLCRRNIVLSNMIIVYFILSVRSGVMRPFRDADITPIELAVDSVGWCLFHDISIHWEQNKMVFGRVWDQPLKYGPGQGTTPFGSNPSYSYRRCPRFLNITRFLGWRIKMPQRRRLELLIEERA
jgi:hypothetical protein